MVDLVLDDLRRPAGEGLDALLKALVLPADLDGLPAPGAAEQSRELIFRQVRKNFPAATDETLAAVLGWNG